MKPAAWNLLSFAIGPLITCQLRKTLHLGSGPPLAEYC